jgi:hypothetical protein
MIGIYSKITHCLMASRDVTHVIAAGCHDEKYTRPFFASQLKSTFEDAARLHHSPTIGLDEAAA